MEWILIHENQLKIMLRAEELEEFGLSADAWDYSDPASKRMLRVILERVRRQSGFDTNGYRILVRLFPSRCGGCELFVTKLSELKRNGGEESDDEPQQRKGALLPLPSSEPLSEQSDEPSLGAFGFERLSHLISACRRLLAVGYVSASAAYVDDDGRYYLFFEKPRGIEYLPVNELSFLAEYGVPESPELLRDVLDERGRLLCERQAVETLGIL